MEPGGVASSSPITIAYFRPSARNVIVIVARDPVASLSLVGRGPVRSLGPRYIPPVTISCERHLAARLMFIALSTRSCLIYYAINGAGK